MLNAANHPYRLSRLLLLCALSVAQFSFGQASAPKQPASASDKFAGCGGIYIVSDALGTNFVPYLTDAHGAITKTWYGLIPKEARAPELKSGTVWVKVSILKDGTKKEVQVVRSSGDAALDQAAVDAVAKTKLDPLPASFTGEKITFRFDFCYNPPEGLEPRPNNSPRLATTPASLPQASPAH